MRHSAAVPFLCWAVSRKAFMLHVYMRRSPSPVRGMSASSSTSNIRTSQNVQALPSSYSASNLAVAGSASRELLGEPRHQYRPQRPTFLNVPDNTYCLSCLPSGLNFSAAMAAKQLPAHSREEVRHSTYVNAHITRSCKYSETWVLSEKKVSYSDLGLSLLRLFTILSDPFIELLISVPVS